MKQRMSKKINAGMIAAASGIILIAGFLRWFELSRDSFYYDELYNVWSGRLSLFNMLKEQLAGDHPPLYYAIAKGWYFFGTGEVWTRSLSVVAGIFTVLFIYLAAEQLFSRRAGLWAAAFAAASPVLVWYSRANTYYSFMIAMAALSFWLLVRASMRGGWLNWAAYTLAAVALLFSYFFGAVLIGAGWLIYFLVGKLGKKYRYQWLTSQLVLLAMVLLAYLFSRSAVAEPHRFHIPAPGQLVGFIYDIAIAPFVLLLGLGDPAVNYAGTGGLPKGHILLALLMVIAGSVAFVYLKWFRDLVKNRSTIALAIGIFIMVAGPWLLQETNGGQLSGRFIVWAAPFFMLFLAAIVAAAPRKNAAKMGTILLVGLISVSVWEIYHVQSGDADWRSMIGIVNKERMPGDMLVGFPLHNVTIAADYYLTKPMPISGGFPASDNKSVYFLKPGETWGGYQSGYFVGSGKGSPLSGPFLSGRINEDTLHASRLWLVEMDGLESTINPGIDQNWTAVKTWNYASFKMTLLDRKTNTT